MAEAFSMFFIFLAKLSPANSKRYVPVLKPLGPPVGAVLVKSGYKYTYIYIPIVKRNSLHSMAKPFTYTHSSPPFVTHSASRPW